MIRSALLLVRTSLPAVMVLAVSLFTLADITSDEQEDPASEGAGSILSLAPLPKTPAPAGAGSAILQSALFDPDHRPETISGSVDDLRSGERSAAPAVTIAGVLLNGGTRKAMLQLGDAKPSWSGIGDELGGWRVADIDGDGAVLERDGQSLTLRVVDRFKLRQKSQSETGAPEPPGEALSGTQPLMPPGAPQPPPEP